MKKIIFKTILYAIMSGLLSITFADCAGEPTVELQAKFREAMKVYNLKRTNKAETLLREILLEDGNFIEAHIMLGRLYFYQNRNELAEIAFSEAANLDRANITSRYYLAMIYAKNKNHHGKALRLLDDILAKNSEFIQARQLKGKIYEARGDLKTALGLYHHADYELKKASELYIRMAAIYSGAQLREKSTAALKRAYCMTAGDKQSTVNLKQL